jgi:phospholipase/lecithinase/hemolysin
MSVDVIDARFARWRRIIKRSARRGRKREKRTMLKRMLIGTAATLTITAGQALAGSPFTAIYSFGDSLSDVGNVFTYTSIPGNGPVQPAPPYVDGQFSNGPVWVQDLATKLGLPPLTPSLIGGTDYAWGGATTGYAPTDNPLAPVPTLTQQIATFGPHAPSSALYTFSIGANDLFGILGTPGLSGAQAENLAAGAAAVVATDAGTLESEGAKDLVLFDVPDLGVTPGVTAEGPAASAAATALSAYFDQQVLSDLAPVEHAGLKVFDLNTYTLIDEVVSNPAPYGFSNVTDPCYVGPFTGGGTVCSNPNSYLFWDDVHPTAAGHLLVADAALSAMGLAVPEPSTWAMILLGLASLGVMGYRREKSVAVA